MMKKHIGILAIGVAFVGLGFAGVAEADVYTMQVEVINSTQDAWMYVGCVGASNTGGTCTEPIELGAGGIAYAYVYIPTSGTLELAFRAHDLVTRTTVTCSQTFKASFTASAIVTIESSGCSISIHP